MTLGIIGGLGPLAGAHFYRRLTERTDAVGDAAHISVVLSGNPQIPDRTAFLLGKSTEDPTPHLLREAKRLVAAGADILVLLCHTAHAFFSALRASLQVPLLHMPRIALRTVAARGYRRVGILCTEGCYRAGVFSLAAAGLPLTLFYPTDRERAAVNRLIYNEIKCGKGDPCVAKFEIPPSFLRKEVDAILLGCTELSLLHPPSHRRESPSFYRTPYITADCVFADPLEMVAEVCIGLCGKKIKGEEYATWGTSFTFAERAPTEIYRG